MRVYFRLESLHVEIFSARDVIPLDPNGDAEHDFLLTIIDIRVTLKLKEQSLCSVHSAHCAAGSDPTVEGLSDPFVTIELLPRRIFNNCEAMYVYNVTQFD